MIDYSCDSQASEQIGQTAPYPRTETLLLNLLLRPPPPPPHAWRSTLRRPPVSCTPADGLSLAHVFPSLFHQYLSKHKCSPQRHDCPIQLDVLARTKGRPTHAVWGISYAWAVWRKAKPACRCSDCSWKQDIVPCGLLEAFRCTYLARRTGCTHPTARSCGL